METFMDEMTQSKGWMIDIASVQEKWIGKICDDKKFSVE